MRGLSAKDGWALRMLVYHAAPVTAAHDALVLLAMTAETARVP